MGEGRRDESYPHFCASTGRAVKDSIFAARHVIPSMVAKLLDERRPIGFAAALEETEVAHAFGVPVMPHVWGSDVLIAVDMHLVSVIPDIPGGLHQFEPMLEYDTTPNLFHEHLLEEPLGICAQVKETGGYVRPPQGPGIGVTLNEDFVKRYRVA